MLITQLTKVEKSSLVDYKMSYFCNRNGSRAFFFWRYFIYCIHYYNNNRGIEIFLLFLFFLHRGVDDDK